MAVVYIIDRRRRSLILKIKCGVSSQLIYSDCLLISKHVLNVTFFEACKVIFRIRVKTSRRSAYQKPGLKVTNQAANQKVETIMWQSAANQGRYSTHVCILTVLKAILRFLLYDLYYYHVFLSVQYVWLSISIVSHHL